MKSVGFKEWAAVCEAMGCGRQSIILRKGGIAEGRDGFSFKYPEFLLFPTWFHEQPQKVNWDGLDSTSKNADSSAVALAEAEHPIQSGAGMPSGEASIEIRYSARLESVHTITSWETAQALEPLHILRPEVVRERFEYDESPGLHVAFVQLFRLEPSWSFPNEKKYGGCRSWVNLPAIPGNVRFEAVLSDAEHEKRKQDFLRVVSAVRSQ